MLRLSSLLLIVTLGTTTLAACGDDGGDPPPPDSMPSVDAAPPDATPARICPDCDDYVSEPLAAGELDVAVQQQIAERFNPAMVFTDPLMFATPADFQLDLVIDGLSPLYRAPDTGMNNSAQPWLDLTQTEEVPAPDFYGEDWGDLPRTNAAGDTLYYWVDMPGDSTGPGYDEETWRATWIDRRDMYTPTQYAHFFWLSKPDGLLAIQFWFFYPYNKFVNNHEGDWERVHVVLSAPDDITDVAGYTLAFAHYSHHGVENGWPAEELVRVGDGAGGDHIVVFVGADGCANYGDATYCGTASGASYPYPGVWTFAASETAAGGTTIPWEPEGVYDADEHTVIILPRLDEPVPFNLSWYKITGLMSQPFVDPPGNHAISIPLKNHISPTAPSVSRFELDVGIRPGSFQPTGDPEPFTPPADWMIITNPTSGF